MMSGIWQPIETAPKDSTEILLFSEGWGVWVDKWTKIDDEEMWLMCDQWENPVEPTHWMPLPEPPDAKDERFWWADDKN